MRVYRVKSKHNFWNELSVNSKIIIINILAFVVLSVLWGLGVLSIDQFAISPKNILSGLYIWTFVTSMFMHGGLFHLFANMFSLFFIGSLVEKILGKSRYLYFYLLSGILASTFFILISWAFSYDLSAYAVGASGALFGLIGFLMIITPDLPVYIMLIPIPIKMKYAAPGVLLALWFVSVAVNIPIGNTAHLGGLISGLFYGIYIRRKYKKKSVYLRRYFS